MTSPHRETPSIGLSMDFLGMSGDDANMPISPSMSLLDYDEFQFSAIGDSMFPTPTDTQPNKQELEAQSSTQNAPLKLNLDATMPLAQSINVPFQNGAIGDRFYNIQQAPPHARNTSITSPSIMLGEQPLVAPVPPGQYGDRDFIHGGLNGIYLQASDELAQSGLDIDFINKVSEGYNVQRPPVTGRNMEGITALRVGIAILCQRSGRVAPSESVLLNFLHQQASRIRDGSGPHVHDIGIDRPLLLDHMLMIVHQYGLRNNEHYNLGVIRPSSSEPPHFGASATYTISLEGPKTVGSKTIWLYEEAGAWFPLARDNFDVSNKSYADALKMPVVPNTYRPVTPTSSNTGLLHPGFISPSTQNTPSEAGSDATGVTSFSCRSCGKKCEGQSELAHHHRNHRHRTLICAYARCGRTFLYHKDLKRHEKTHTDKDTRMDYLCPVPACGKAYTRQDNLRRHQRQDHPTFVPPPPSSIASSRRSHGGSRHGF